ncbi:hypothetical protein F4819DRAFT_508259 [Hypoxylon fuscum]|nr:hypothetical protein F4819DRAFT_508259 [Hypoxylon fuscum]
MAVSSYQRKKCRSCRQPLDQSHLPELVQYYLDHFNGWAVEPQGSAQYVLCTECQLKSERGIDEAILALTRAPADMFINEALNDLLLELGRTNKLQRGPEACWSPFWMDIIGVINKWRHMVSMTEIFRTVEHFTGRRHTVSVMHRLAEQALDLCEQELRCVEATHRITLNEPTSTSQLAASINRIQSVRELKAFLTVLDKRINMVGFAQNAQATYMFR